MKNRLNQAVDSTFRASRLVAAALLISISACSQNYTVSVNNQAVFDPTGRLFNGDLADPDLQGCVNIAMQQQNLQNAELLRVLSCGSSQVDTVEAIEQLTQLRFLDLSNNFIRDVSPLQGLAITRRTESYEQRDCRYRYPTEHDKPNLNQSSRQQQHTMPTASYLGRQAGKQPQPTR